MREVFGSCVRRPARSSHALICGFLLLLGSTGTVRAQLSMDLPRFRIESKEDLINAVGLYDESDVTLVRMAMVALEGRRVLRWLLEVVQDSSLYSPRREAAVFVLGLTRDSLAVAVLLHQVESRSGVWIRAREALRAFPYPAVCDFWRRTLDSARDPSGTVQDAIAGLGFCGTRRDVVRLEGMLSVSVLEFERFLIEVALKRLGRPWAERHRTRDFSGPPQPDGAYVPSESLAATIRRVVCDGPCAQIMLPPSAKLVDPRRRRQ